jgi:hypothetical protein
MTTTRRRWVDLVIVAATCIVLVGLAIAIGRKRAADLSRTISSTVPAATAAANPAAATTPDGFRFAAWGAPKQDVRLLETAPFVREKTVGEYQVLEFTGEFAGMPAAVFYYFGDGQLFQGAYEIRKPFTAYEDHLGDFVRAKSLLAQRYGAPTRDELVWLNSRDRDNQRRWGRALATGQLVLRADWWTPDLEVSQALMGDSSQITLAITLTSKDRDSAASQ